MCEGAELAPERVNLFDQANVAAPDQKEEGEEFICTHELGLASPQASLTILSYTGTGSDQSMIASI